MKRNFLNQHRALEVLLGRYMRTVGDGRATLDGFVSYVRHNRDIKTQLQSFGAHRLRRVISHALESGAYADYRLSKGEGIVKRNYQKQLRLALFAPTERQTRLLGIQ